jgi:hypothetical protein
LAFIAGLPAGLPFGFIQRPALAQALGFGQPGQGFIFFHLLQNRCCIIRSYLLQTVISKGDTDMTSKPASWNVYRKTAQGKQALMITVYTEYTAQAARNAGFTVKPNKEGAK